ncbi:MAG: 3-hydroxyacyl-ACP dehydratase [Ferruginibacter sp.]
MLSGEFFSVASLDQSNGKITAMLQINSGHKIFQGHFPGQPVVPGVCMLQMIKELLELALVRKTRLVNSNNLKFLTVIDPVKTPGIQAELTYKIGDDKQITVTASLLNGSVTYFKMSGVFVFTDPGNVSHH